MILKTTNRNVKTNINVNLIVTLIPSFEKLSIFRYSDEETLEEGDDSEYYVDTISPNRDTPDSIRSQIKTGFAQSDTSLAHQSYCYSNQQGYESGCYGYSLHSGYESGGIARPPVDSTLPKITAAIYKCTLKRSPSSEDLCLAAAGDSTTDQTVPQVVTKGSETNLRQPSIPEETLNDISSISRAEGGAVKIVGYESKKIESKKSDIGIDRIENDVVICK